MFINPGLTFSPPLLQQPSTQRAQRVQRGSNGSRLPLAARPPGHGAAQGHRAQGAAALRAVAATAVPYSVGRGAEFGNGWDEMIETMDWIVSSHLLDS